MDAARIVVDLLNASGVGATAYYGVPDPRPTDAPGPEPFVVVEQTGGSRSERVARTLAVDADCWATTRRGASVLADAVADALERMPDELDDVFWVSVSSVYNNPDLDSGTPRYTVSISFGANV